MGFVLLGEDQWNIMLGALIAATIGALLPGGQKPNAGDELGDDADQETGHAQS